VLLGIFLIGGFWFIEIELPQRFLIRANDGTLAIGRINPDIPRGEIGFSCVDNGYGSPAAAWRPYHSDEGFAHSLVFPLWQPLVLCVALLAYAHGYLRGSRRGDPSLCTDCGYSLRGLPAADGFRRCPECGLEQPVSAVP
jgi:hypothetical protein